MVIPRGTSEHKVAVLVGKPADYEIAGRLGKKHRIVELKVEGFKAHAV